ncbi:bifunctional diaminohydroxyphosphoribosylaminopyrimidine deaminase/5-amino-6-(5-phosphoribosylamino)uracil reductase RibD [Parasulfuritortus cantonensis]|uniref:Riboflavin biosynthesis protein RibD n=1 Tax=Parasulfuritortus cantonensis TaxID=2528202 RepID=A0A4R1BRG7_9PROT|nr:bifunctional diaminohydroxyphosphoribosylaminopyrimidine deaminase/5-amino-6-(5-phosphoribosylamino)uracil reductase RibD [Parasulfuritortus cantonensis]TCJ20231.1 bifunctional diaminohydroxyphosphoribosylaminopyrimidine deaminase/5-amino-6-(5-phosphoribosylamino)uracil reductase RibD [Parasulfuritortus cantonensis]
MSFSAADHGYMARAIRLAEQGLTTATPNPRVGCVLVRAGEVVGEGWHERAGEPHAEVHALRAAGERARGATAYVSLEPCSHHGRTPPCANSLIDAGVARVVAAMTDPNPQVAGRGIQLLTLAGVRAEVGLLEAEARELNVGFVSRMTRGRPWLRLKTAATLDGKTALENGESKWLTGPAARQDVQRWRARACAVLTGSGTVLADDPQMNVRLPGASRQPLRVIVDSRLATPPDARILAGGRVLVACAAAEPDRRAVLEAAGAEVVCLPAAGGRVDLAALMAELGRRGVNELHGEAGATLNGALLEAGLVDEWLAYFAPLVLGHHARGLFDLPALTDMAGRRGFALRDAGLVGGDLRLVLRPTST